MNKTLDVLIFIAVIIISFFYYFKKNKKNRILLTIISFLVLAVWFYYVVSRAPDSNDYKCMDYAFFKAKKINKEIVINKIGSLHMMSKVIILLDFENDKNDTIFFTNEKSNIYDKITFGEMLVKKEKSDSLFVLKNGKLVFLNQFNCGCDSTIYRIKHS
jgi:hypothetical protein